MLILGFLSVSSALILALGFLVQFRSYQSVLRGTLLALSLMLTAHVWIGYLAVFAPNVERWLFMHRVLMALELLIGLGMLALTSHFLRGGQEGSSRWGPLRVPLFAVAAGGAGVGALIAFLPSGLRPDPASWQIDFRGLGQAVPVVICLLAIYTLYLLENTYRFARDYQRRIGRLCFIGVGMLSLFHIFYFSRMVLFQQLPLHFPEASSVVYSIVYPVVLAGFLRYRLGSELISIPRDAVYSSATMFLTGAAFLGVALTVFFFRWLHLDFSYFERFLIGFSLCFLALLIFGSGTMRRRITRFVNQNLYSQKYDYQDQFFRLHKSLLFGSDVDTALTELVENMKYSVTVDDAYFFALNWQDGNFYQHENKEEATSRDLILGGDSPVARMLAAGGGPVDLLGSSPEDGARREAARAEPLVGQLGLDAVFPVLIGEGPHGERLAGILALQGGRSAPFDSEDLELIGVFTSSIGNAIFRSRVLQERMEQKQFESFHHVASFIIHDIKNQVATLSLVLKNAERNIGNPSFQASMLTSVKSCAGNLQSLINRLAVGPQRHDLSLGAHSLRALIDEVAANSGLAAPPPWLDIHLAGEDAVAGMDRRALFFVIRNLVNNSLEAIQGRFPAGSTPGRLAIGYGPLRPAVPTRLRELFGGGEQFFSGYGSYVLVEDTGVGMEPEFVRRRLFQPFATTKEQGVGIGLFQCKTLVDRMGGRILCHSELGKGTEFCLLLAPAESENGAT